MSVRVRPLATRSWMQKKGALRLPSWLGNRLLCCEPDGYWRSTSRPLGKDMQKPTRG